MQNGCLPGGSRFEHYSVMLMKMRKPCIRLQISVITGRIIGLRLVVL